MRQEKVATMFSQASEDRNRIFYKRRRLRSPGSVSFSYIGLHRQHIVFIPERAIPGKAIRRGFFTIRYKLDVFIPRVIGVIDRDDYCHLKAATFTDSF